MFFFSKEWKIAWFLSDLQGVDPVDELLFALLGNDRVEFAQNVQRTDCEVEKGDSEHICLAYAHQLFSKARQRLNHQEIWI